MKKLSMITAIFFCLLSTILAPSTHAEDSVGLQAGPAKAIINEDVKQGDEVKINKLFIQNTGSLREKVIITTEGGVSVEKETLILKPQEKVFLEASLKPDFSMVPGKMQGKIIVSATEDEGKGIQHNPAVELQFNYNLIEGSFANKMLYFAKTNIYVQSGGGAIVLAILAVIIVGRVKKKRKNEPETQVELAV